MFVLLQVLIPSFFTPSILTPIYRHGMQYRATSRQPRQPLMMMMMMTTTIVMIVMVVMKRKRKRKRKMKKIMRKKIRTITMMR
jgi:hypothetical protein